jgi:hypothetical protein
MVRLALAASFIGLAQGPAVSQQVIVCFTLHNDLTNFDRRAQAVDPSWSAILEAQARADQTVADYKAICIDQTGQPAETCDRLSGQAWDARQQVEAMMSDYVRSPIGGGDPVRLNLIAELRRNGCLRGATFISDGAGATRDILPPRASVKVKG